MSNDLQPRLSGALATSRLALPGTANVRDLAGYPAGNGFMIGAHRLLRGEVLAEPGGSEMDSVWDVDASALFESLGLRTVIDLRSEHEASRTPSAWGRATGAEITSCPSQRVAKEPTPTSSATSSSEREPASISTT